MEKEVKREIEEETEEQVLAKMGKGLNLFDRDKMNPLLDKQYLKQNKTIQDEAGVIEYLTKVSVLPTSFYHAFIPKELSLSNLRREDLPIIDLYVQLINNGIYLADRGYITADIPLMDAVELVTFLNATRAIDMKHERLMSENTVNLRKTEEVKTPGFKDRYLRRNTP